MGQVIYLFDVDGTLTKSREPISSEHYHFMCRFMQEHMCYLVSGSTYQMIIEQVGALVDQAVLVFGCQGNEIYEKGVCVHKYNWVRKDLEELLEFLLKGSGWDRKMGNHIVRRPGMYNFSIPGRSADMDTRKDYVEYERVNKERPVFKRLIESVYCDLEVSIGGQTSIDISPQGKDKGQVVDWLFNHNVRFFGDKCQPGGNDHPLVKILGERNCTQVRGPDETYSILRNL